MTALPESAPFRRLPPRRQSRSAILWALVGVVALAAMLVACAIYTAPVLISDWRIRDTARPMTEARISDGRCNSKIVVHVCNLTLTLRQPAGTVTRRVNYVFSGLHLGDFSAGAMGDPAQPDRITTTLGLDRLWNRTLTLVVIMIAFATIIVGALVALVRNWRASSSPNG